MLLKQPSICLIALWSQAVPDMTWALEEAGQTAGPPQHSLMLFLIQFDLARGIQQQTMIDNNHIKKSVFAYVYKCDRSSYITVFTLMFCPDRGSQL